MQSEARLVDIAADLLHPEPDRAVPRHHHHGAHAVLSAARLRREGVARRHRAARADSFPLDSHRHPAAQIRHHFTRRYFQPVGWI